MLKGGWAPNVCLLQGQREVWDYPNGLGVKTTLYEMRIVDREER